MCAINCSGGCPECSPEDHDPAFDRLEQMAANKAEDDEYEEEPDGVVDLEAVNDTLKKTAVLLEFLGDPDFCKNITKRERQAINRQLDKIYAQVEEIEGAIAEIEADEDE